MKNLLTILFIGISIILDASPVRSSVGHHHISMMEGEEIKPYSAKDYVQDGLVAMWDGIENVGWGVHDDNATSWADLTGGGANWSLVGSPISDAFEVGGDYVKVLKGVSWGGVGHCTPSWEETDLVSFEIVFDTDGYDTSTNNMVQIAAFGLSSGSGKKIQRLGRDSNVGGGALVFTGDAGVPVIPIEVGANGISYSYSSLRALHNGIIGDFQSARFGRFSYFPPIISEYGSGHPPIGIKIKAMRIYNRILTDAERLANYAIDKVRFNLP